jgi:hypothetical protein
MRRLFSLPSLSVMLVLAAASAVPAQEYRLERSVRKMLDTVPLDVVRRVDLEGMSALPDCPAEPPFDECFGHKRIEFAETDGTIEIVTRVGHWIENAVWTGLAFSDGDYQAYYLEGEYHSPSCSQPVGSEWYVCPDGTRLRSLTGYLDGNGYLQGKWIVEFSPNQVFEGSFVDDKKEGFGILSSPDGSTYSGDWSNDLRHGEAVAVSAGGNRYVGTYRFDLRHGQGSYEWTDGSRYEGAWADGEMTGQGTMYYPDGSTQTGLWREGTFVGRSGQGSKDRSSNKGS